MIPEDDFTLTELEEFTITELNCNPHISWYRYLLFPWWLLCLLCRLFYEHILLPAPPDYVAKKLAKEARQKEIEEKVSKQFR